MEKLSLFDSTLAFALIFILMKLSKGMELKKLRQSKWKKINKNDNNSNQEKKAHMEKSVSDR